MGTMHHMWDLNIELEFCRREMAKFSGGTVASTAIKTGRTRDGMVPPSEAAVPASDSGIQGATLNVSSDHHAAPPSLPPVSPVSVGPTSAVNLSAASGTPSPVKALWPYFTPGGPDGDDGDSASGQGGPGSTFLDLAPAEPPQAGSSAVDGLPAAETVTWVNGGSSSIFEASPSVSASYGTAASGNLSAAVVYTMPSVSSPAATSAYSSLAGTVTTTSVYGSPASYSSVAYVQSPSLGSSYGTVVGGGGGGGVGNTVFAVPSVPVSSRRRRSSSSHRRHRSRRSHGRHHR